jgi:predicted nucleotidyltransferase
MTIGSLSKKDVAGLLLDALRKYPEIRGSKIFVFGSQAVGQAHRSSDIDIGIEGKTAVPTRVLALLRADIEELPILYPVDIVDFSVAAESLKRAISIDKIYLTQSL